MIMLTYAFWNARERRLRAFWRLLLLVVAIALLAVAPTIGVGEGLAALHRAGVWLPGQSEALFDKTVDFIVGPLLTVLIVAAVLISSRFIDRRAPGALGLKPGGMWWSEYACGLVLGAALIAIVFGAEWAMGWVRVEPRTAPGIVGVPGAVLWAFVGIKVLCVGVYEEVLFRGGLMKNLAEGFSAAPPALAALSAALITALIFAGLHGTNENFTAASFYGLTALGLLFATPVLLTGRLGLSIGLHTTWNFMQGGVLGYPVSGDAENISLVVSTATGPVAWTGGAFGPEAGYLSWAAAAIGIAAIIGFFRTRNKRVAILSEIAQFAPRLK
jgi:uncharacterized protein